MKKSASVAWLALVGTLAAAEPEAASIEKWVAQLSSANRDGKREAVYQLGKMEPRQVKAALPMLIAAVGEPDKQIWSGALAVLARLGPDAADAVPALLDLLDGKDGGRTRDQNQLLLRIAFTLAQIGPAAKPSLINALQPAVPAVSGGRRLGAIRALGLMGDKATDAIPHLTKNLAAAADQFFPELVDALSLMGPTVVAPLVTELSAPDARSRQGAALALAKYGPTAGATAAKAVLAQLAKEQDVQTKITLLTAVGRVGTPPEIAATVLRANFYTDPKELRQACANGLLGSPVIATQAVPLLIQDLQAPDASKRQQAAQLLGRFGERAQNAVTALIARAEAEPSEPAYAAALAQIGPAALPALLEKLSAGNAKGGQRKWLFNALSDMGTPAMPALSQALRSPQPRVRAAGAMALEGMALDRTPIAKQLLELILDKEPAVRAASFRTLAAVRSERNLLIPRLEEGLNDGDEQVRKASAIGLATAGAAGKLGVSGLLLLLSEPELETRKSAIISLGSMGKDAAPAITQLIKAAEVPELQLAIVETLGHLGEAGAPAIPVLLKAAQSSDLTLRGVAFTALGNLGPAAGAALPVLYDTFQKSDSELRLTAMHALARVETDATKLTEMLTKAMNGNSSRLRRSATEDIEHLGPKIGLGVVPGLIRMLESVNERAEGLRALRALEIRDQRILLQLLDHPEAKARVIACKRFAALGKEALAVLPKLQEKAKSDQDEVRDAAKSAIAAMQ